MCDMDLTYKGRQFKIKATCRHCGHVDDLDDFKKVLVESTDGLILCPNEKCDALDDPGMWLSLERI